MAVLVEANSSSVTWVPLPLQNYLMDLRHLCDLVVGGFSAVLDLLDRDGQTLQEGGVRKHAIAYVDAFILLLASELHERIQLHHGSECSWVLVLAPLKTQLQTDHCQYRKVLLLTKLLEECVAL